MSSRSKKDLCRICGGALHGNQRRWLFGNQNKTTEFLRGGSLSGSRRSSPWGSTLSLGTSASLSKSQSSLNSPSKALDLLSVLTHILGQSVPRLSGQGEFVCGKCVSILERVFKFDTVIARVRLLSSERLHKLTQERDKIRRWVRQSYHQMHPRPSSTSDDDEEAETQKEGYREMLKENMALSQYESWSEMWDTCPQFKRACKTCRKGKGCTCCDSFRVSDSDYESACGVPRHLPSQAFYQFPLSRDKSQSMPLDWIRSSPASLAGSTLSLRAASRIDSIQSLDSLDGNDSLDHPAHQSDNYLIKELRSILGKPVSSPPGSRIPVLDKKDGRYYAKPEKVALSAVSRVLKFENASDGVKDVDEQNVDVVMEPMDEFMPFHSENTSDWVNHAVRRLQTQLQHGDSYIRNVGADLYSGSHNSTAEVNGSDRRTDVIKTLRLEMRGKERSLEEEIEALRKAGRDREKDLDTLTTVLQCNQDIINDIQVALQEKELLRMEMEKEREVWSRREQIFAAVQQEKDSLICCLQEELESCQKNVQAHSGSVIGQKSEAALLDERWVKANVLNQHVTKLSTVVREYQDIMQNQRETCNHMVSSLMAQLRDVRQELRDKEQEKKGAERLWQSRSDALQREEAKLKKILDEKDQLIQQILVEQDGAFRALQQNQHQAETAV